MFAFNSQTVIIMIIIAVIPAVLLLVWCFSKNNVSRYVMPLGLFLVCIFAILIFSESVVSIWVPVPRSIIFGRVYSHGFWNTKRMVVSLSGAYIGSVLLSVFMCSTLIVGLEFSSRFALNRVESELFDCHLTPYLERIFSIYQRSKRIIEKKNAFAQRTQLYYIIALYQHGKVQEAIELCNSLLFYCTETISKPIQISLYCQLARMYEESGQNEECAKADKAGRMALSQLTPKNVKTKTWIANKEAELLAQDALLENNFQTAVENWSALLEHEHLDYNRAMIYCQLSKAYKGLGMYDQTNNAIQKAMELARDFYSVKKTASLVVNS